MILIQSTKSDVQSTEKILKISVSESLKIKIGPKKIKQETSRKNATVNNLFMMCLDLVFFMFLLLGAH